MSNSAQEWQDYTQSRTDADSTHVRHAKVAKEEGLSRFLPPIVRKAIAYAW